MCIRDRDKDMCVISEELAKQNNLKIGDKISFNDYHLSLIHILVFIHGGKVLFSKPKDELLENYGIIKCNSTQFNEIDKSDIISYRKLDYE